MFRLWEECKDAKTIAITGHERPDGDCVGASMAAYLFLKKKNPDAQVRVFIDKPSEKFSCIQDFDKIEYVCPDDYEPDVFIMVDVDKARTGIASGLYDKAKKTINIDHHISNQNGSAMVNYVVPTASSASELIYDVIDREDLDVEIAKAIYIGMIHDTGIFQYSNTTPKTLQVAADLMSFGFDFTGIIEQTYQQASYIQTQIYGRALLESIIFMDGACVVSQIDQKTMDFYGATSNDMNNIAGRLRSIRGVECAIFMYEIGTQQYKVSLRSSEKVDVRKVAEIFGGGGHIRAAGCIMNGSFHDVVNNLSKYIEMQIQEQ